MHNSLPTKNAGHVLSNLVSVFLNLYQICNDHKKDQGFEISFSVPQNTYELLIV